MNRTMQTMRPQIDPLIKQNTEIDNKPIDEGITITRNNIVAILEFKNLSHTRMPFETL